MTTQTVSGGALVNFTLPDLGATNATQWPWLDAGARSGTMYVVLKSRADINWSGTAIANYGPVLTYTDPFQQVYTATGNLQTVEAHGANVVATYTIKGITTTVDGVARDGIVPGVENAVAVDVLVSNLGDYIASTPRITVVLPSGVVVSQTSVVPVVSAPGYVVFDLRNLAPGDSQPVSLLLDLASPAATAPWRLITRTDGFFVNRFTTVSGQTRDAPVAARLAGPLDVGKARQRIYLPLVSRNALMAPDLIVQNLVVTHRSVQVVIKNQGNAPVNDDFWVDVYINPNPAPTHVNQVWWMLGKEGLVWGVKDTALPIQPGGVMTLTLGDRYYTSTLSTFSGWIPNGTPVYAQVDAANTNTTYGGVLESHEILNGLYNNIAGPVYPAVDLTTNVAASEPALAGDRSPASDSLPPRP